MVYFMLPLLIFFSGLMQSQPKYQCVSDRLKSGKEEKSLNSYCYKTQGEVKGREGHGARERKETLCLQNCKMENKDKNCGKKGKKIHMETKETPRS